MISFDNVSFKYSSSENSVLDGISLDIEEGSFVAVLGHNGSGKSTLAKMINGMLLPTEGKVNVMGMDTSSEEAQNKIHRKVGMVFQNPENQIIYSIVEEDVAFGPENQCLPREEIRRRIDDSLEKVGMSQYVKADTFSLSGGQKQRIAVAGVLASGPDCIVFDEATSMLDPKGRRDILDIARKLNKEDGITIIWITHLMREIVNADRAIVMNSGRIMLDDKPAEILARVDDMRLLGLGVPQVHQLFHRLNEEGYDFDLTDIDKCSEQLKAMINAAD